MEKQRSRGVVISGSAVIVCSILWLLLNAPSLFFTSTSTNALVDYVLGVILPIALLVCGCFILKLKNWARLVLIYLLFLVVILLFIDLVITFRQGDLNAFFGVVIVVIFPISLVYYFSKNSVAKIFEPDINSYAVASFLLGVTGILIPIVVISLLAIYVGEKYKKLKNHDSVLENRILAFVGSVLGAISVILFIFDMIKSQGVFSMLNKLDAGIIFLLIIFLSPVVGLFIWFDVRRRKNRKV